MRALLLLLLLPSVVLAQPTAEQVAKLDVTVAPETERKALAGMMAELLRARQKEANDRSTAEWKTITNREQWEAFVTPKLKALRDSLGTFPEPTAPTVRVASTVEGDGFAIDNILYESRPGLWVSANLYRPAKPTGSMPGMVIVHAHHTPKEHVELQDMGMTWARAGCLVLVPDMLGHGERRQHPFVDASSYPKQYRVSRQDYFFRYDNGIRLHLVGESLIGWMAWDIWRGVDVLLKQKGCDPKRLILLGSVAGGGDPCAVAAALDERIAAAVPFNFGGPQPESRYPLPEDAETSFNYMGGGSWESTRNLRLSARDGFLPWVIVGSLAKRKLVYAHEFNWDRERDPVWKRLQTIAGWYGNADGLAFTTGKGSVRGSSPEDTHCTHIGPVQRKAIHEAFRKWFGIEATEYKQRVPAEKLKCWTPEVEKELKPKTLSELLDGLSKERLVATDRWSADRKPLGERRRILRDEFKVILGGVESGKVTIRLVGTEIVNGLRIAKLMLSHENGIVVPLVLLSPTNVEKPPVVVLVSLSGKDKIVKADATVLSQLLARGIAVCLPDVRATGETGLGNGRGRNSSATSYSSSLMLHGDTLLGGQLRDLRATMAWLRSLDTVDGKKVAIWGESLAKMNPDQTDYKIPRDDDASLPLQSEPLGGFLALLGALYENDVRGGILNGFPMSFRDELRGPLVSIPHDIVVPGLLKTCDIESLVFALEMLRFADVATIGGGNREGGQSVARGVLTHHDTIPGWFEHLLLRDKKR
jgi:dienelactone hydrolase